VKDAHPFAYCALQHGESGDFMWRRPIGSGVIPRVFDGGKESIRLIAARVLTAIFETGPNEKECQMPYAVTSDKVASISRKQEAGHIIFLHESRPTTPTGSRRCGIFSRGHAASAYSARGYTPSDVPSSSDVYTYKHFYTDALAVLDHLESTRRISSACRWGPIPRCRSA